MRFSHIGRPAVLCVVCLFPVCVAGCHREASKPEDSTATPSVRGPKEIARPITDAEATQLARVIEDAARKGDAAAFGRPFDLDAVLEIATAGIEAPPATRNAFVNGARSGMTEQGGVAGQILKACKDGGSYDLLRMRTRERHRSLLFRLTMPNDAGVSYQELILSRGKDDQVRIVDIYAFFSGENLSATLRRGFIELAANANRNLLERLTRSEREFVKHVPKIQEATAASRNGQPKQALALLKELPPSLQKDKTVLLLRIQAAQNSDERDYEAAITDFRSAFPNDPAADMLSIDYHALRKEYDQALACLDRLEASVGGDPRLQIQRAGIRVLAGDYAAALRDVHKLVEQEPDYVHAYWTLVSVSLSAMQYGETLDALKTIRTKFSLEPGDMTQEEAYKGFVRAPEYQQWLKWVASQKDTEDPGSKQ